MSYNFQRIKVLITSGCNSNCVHCFRNKEKNTELISFDKLKEIVDFGVKNGCRHFGFSGGEFFTHPNCYDLINYCLKQEINIKILTNAIQIDVDFFSKILKKELISFQVSIDGLEKSHDNRRGKGSFQTTIENVKKLYSLGYKLTTKMVLDTENYMDFPSVLEMPWFDKVLVLPMAFYNEDSMDYDIEEYKAYEEVMQIIYQRMLLNGQQVIDCMGYPNELAIKYDGNVYPCTEAREHNEFLMGNVTNKSLEEVLRAYDESDQEKLDCKNVKIEKCLKCRHKNICNSGCRLRALRFNGDFFSHDPFNCRIYNNEYTNIPIGKLLWGK